MTTPDVAVAAYEGSVVGVMRKVIHIFRATRVEPSESGPGNAWLQAEG